MHIICLFLSFFLSFFQRFNVILFQIIIGKLYVAGGFDGHACLFSAERYDPVVDQWTLLQPMTTSRSGVSMAVCDDKIYAIGGYDGAARLDSGLQEIRNCTVF